MKASEIRQKLLGRAKPTPRLAGEVPGIGKVYVRAASVAERTELMRLGNVQADGTLAVADQARFQALLINRLACDEEGARIWEDTDVQALTELAVDDPYWVVVAEAAGKALVPAGQAIVGDTDAEKAKSAAEAKKAQEALKGN